MPLLFLSQKSYAQEDTLKTALNKNFSSSWRLEASLLLGAGLENHEVGRSTENDEITMSGGGGIGGHLMIGYGLSDQWDLSLGVMIQNSALTPQVENATGKFFRTAIMANLKYRYPIFSSGLINFGGGIGYYFPGDLDVDLSSVPEGAHNIYGYENTLGFQLQCEYEGMLYPDLYWAIGLKYYYVSYKIKSARSNGIPIPIDQLPSEVNDQIGKLDGSGIDLVLSLNYYL